jgi:polyhydroxybutyrate depolymerase
MQKKKWIFIAISICLASQIVYGEEKQFLYDDSIRSYVIYEPLLAPEPDGYPLVIGLHGGGAGFGGYSFLGTANLVPKANAERFIVACPNSLMFGIAFWNAGSGYEQITNGTDDTGFISAVIDSMIANYDIDTTRIYLMGHSNGSMMAYRVAAELSRRIAGLAVNSGQMVYEYCNPKFPVPILHFHGLDDDKCAYEGAGDSLLVLPSVDSVMAIWGAFNKCTSVPDTILNENGILGRKWASLDGKGDIVLYTIENWGHSWPRKGDPGIDASDVMWDFLKVHHKSTATNIKEDCINSLPDNFRLYQNCPNPFNPSTMIRYTLYRSSHIVLSIYNLVGQEIETLVNKHQPEGEYEINWQAKGLPNGLYFYKIQAGDYSETKKLIIQK